ncbi:MAG: hypothetical protein ABJB12_08510 [Pseudomonadota bacterium]
MLTGSARASGCAPNPSLSACFDANSLWLPSGKASFISMPDTRVTGVGRVSFAAASEWLRRPVVLHVDSPDAGGRDVQAVGSALDASFFLSFGVAKALELNLAAPLRLYQVGAGTAGIASQSAPPLERNAVRNPRLGLAYSLDDAIALQGLGLRLALDASLPLASEQEFAGERSLVVMPNAALSLRAGMLLMQAEVGARLRRSLDFGGIRLGNQGVIALGWGLDLLDPGRLFVGLEAFALPALGDGRAAQGPSGATSSTRVTYVPAEWLVSVRSCFRRNNAWSLGVAAGTGIALSSETRSSAAGTTTTRFLGVATPDFRSLLVLRFAPAADPESAR